MTPYEQHVLKQRRHARAQQALVDERRLVAHIAVADALEGPDAAKILADALAQISRWLDQGLCHPDYADHWRATLALAPSARRSAILTNDVSGLALRQNTPFADFLVHTAK